MYQYRLPELLDNLLSAAARADVRPDPQLSARYKKHRVTKAAKALLCNNLFLPLSATEPSVDQHSTFTLYTPPLGEDVIVVGYCWPDILGDGLSSQTAEVRVRVVGDDKLALAFDLTEHLTVGNFVGGMPRLSEPYFTAPIMLKASQQLAVDWGFNQNFIDAQDEPALVSLTFLCVRVKRCASKEDQQFLNEIARAVKATDFQVPVYLNAGTLPFDDVRFSAVGAGGISQIETRPASRSLLVTGFTTNLLWSQMKITDTFDGYSFSYGRFGYIKDFMLQDQANCWLYFEFPTPHLLRAGATLRVNLINGRGPNSAGETITDDDGMRFIFSCVTP